MSDPDPRHDFGFRRRLVFARAAAAFEALWPALWPPLAVIGLFLIVSLFGVWLWLPVWLHAAGLAAFAAALGWALWQAARALRWPDREAGLGRLEAVNALSHQPLRSLGDQLSGGGRDPGTLSLWRRHRERLLRSLVGLRVGAPRSDMPRRDPWALRIAVLLVLVVAGVQAGRMAPERLGQAFALDRPGGGPPPVELTMWVTPPAYTGRPPLRLAAEQAGSEEDAPPRPSSAVQVPEGSEVLAQLHHLEALPDRIRLSLGEEGQAFTRVGQGSAEAELVIESSGELRVGSTAKELGVWQIEAVPDLIPEIEFAQAPAPTHRGVLRVGFSANDDHGLTSIALVMRRQGDDDGKSERMELVRPAKGTSELEDAAYLDLTPHPWAGLPVTLQLEAADAIEQTGQSETVDIELPMRTFEHPLARAIIEQRRQLALEPDDRREVAGALDRMSQEPRLYQGDPAVMLALRSAVQRLMLNEDDKSIEDVIALLWETALHLEDGSLSLAERELRELQEALRRALAEGASDEELERLLDQLEQAMQDYLEALARQAQEMGEDQQPMPMDPEAMEVQSQDLQEMLDRAREMVRTGAREAAREMLAQLQQMLENLRVAQQGQQGQEMQQGQQMLNQLQEMIERQQGLLDQTFRLSRQQGQQGQQGQEGQQGQMQQGQQGQRGQQQGQMGQGQRGRPAPGQGQPGGQLGELSAGQEALRRALGEMMRSVGEAGVSIPRSLGEAELSMREARDALEDGQPGSATDPQAEAIDQLRQGGQAMLEQMQQMMAQGQGEVPGQPFGPNPDGRDPLGRSLFNQGGADLFGERVPSELDLGKARQIMEELYRRAGERNRPAEELDYLERLLRRF